jgi:hypothetical protein
VRIWAEIARVAGVNQDKTDEAMLFAETMESWQRRAGCHFPD